MSLPVADPAHFRQLLLSDTPFLDVRAEIEFSRGAFPSSDNLPILNTIEREQVGTCYKKHGQEQAIALGHKLVSGQLKEQRIQAWCDFARSHSNPHLYCWRGGLRSNLAQQWMSAAGVDIPLVAGGFKALRRVLLDEIDAVVEQTPLIVIGGKTGSAKTVLINALARAVDLEHHARHRGSSFGRRVVPPPSQINFEHALAIDFLKLREQQIDAPVFLEDESHLVGTCAIPLPLFTAMKLAPMALLEVPFAERVEHVLDEYVIEMLDEYETAFPGEGMDRYSDYLLASLQRIRKRLGMERFQALELIMREALNLQRSHNDVSHHRLWIESLLRDYYDPMYDYQLGKVNERVVFKGDRDSVLAWCRQR